MDEPKAAPFLTDLLFDLIEEHPGEYLPSLRQRFTHPLGEGLVVSQWTGDLLAFITNGEHRFPGTDGSPIVRVGIYDRRTNDKVAEMDFGDQDHAFSVDDLEKLLVHLGEELNERLPE